MPKDAEKIMKTDSFMPKKGACRVQKAFFPNGEKPLPVSSWE